MFVAPVIPSDLISDAPADEAQGHREGGAATTRPIADLGSGKACPCCGAGSAAWRPIRYGMVAASVLAQARRGEVVLGSVNYGRNEPQWACISCDTRFGRPREDRDRFGRPIAQRDARVEVLEPAALRGLGARLRQRRRSERRRAA